MKRKRGRASIKRNHKRIADIATIMGINLHPYQERILANQWDKGVGVLDARASRALRIFEGIFVPIVVSSMVPKNSEFIL